MLKHSVIECMVMCVKFILIIYTFMPLFLLSDMNSWECSKFEGSKIVAEDGTELGEIGPSWKSDSIFNDSSEYASTWSQTSIFNKNSDYGSSFSNLSAFNESASNPPMIIGDYGLVGYLSIGPSWDSERFSPYDIKYTCDWD